jgi:glycosyltransferase involved in cell wall biosynthesis
MNVLFLDSIECETYGGMEEWIRLVASGIQERDHRVLVVGRSGSEFLRRVGESGIQTLPLAITGDFNPLTIARVRKQLLSDKTDLVCVNFTKDIRLGGLAARFGGRAQVVWSVGLDITKDSWAHRALTPRLIDSVIVPSESLKQQITARGYIRPEIVTVIPVGIPDNPAAVKSAEAVKAVRERFKLPPDATVAVTVGRFVEQKGHITLIDAIPELDRQWPNLYYLFLGDGPLQPVLKSRAEALGVLDKLRFAGMLDDTSEIVAGADLMIHPSIEEPFGIAILEGMRAGLPIVASEVGGIPEVVGTLGGAILVEPRNPSALASAVIDILGDKARAEEMSRRNRSRFVEHFTVSTMIDRVERQFTAACRKETVSG